MRSKVKVKFLSEDTIAITLLKGEKDIELKLQYPETLTIIGEKDSICKEDIDILILENDGIISIGRESFILTKNNNTCIFTNIRNNKIKVIRDNVEYLLATSQGSAINGIMHNCKIAKSLLQELVINSNGKIYLHKYDTAQFNNAIDTLKDGTHYNQYSGIVEYKVITDADTKDIDVMSNDYIHKQLIGDYTYVLYLKYSHRANNIIIDYMCDDIKLIENNISIIEQISHFINTNIREEI